MKNDHFYDIIDKEIEDLIEVFKNNDHLKKQDENGKKSFAFLLWFLKEYLPNCQLENIENYITEGNDDSSCDLIFNNTDQSGSEIYYVVQAKWFSKNNINNSKGISKEVKACLSDFKLILSGKKEPSEVNPNFNIQYENFLNHKKNNGKVKFIFLALCRGDINIEKHIEDFVNMLVAFDLIDFSKLKKQYIEIKYKGIITHNPIEEPYIPKAKFNLSFKKEQFIHIGAPYESYIFLVEPKEIYNLFEKYGNSLFYKNIRNPLPKSFFNEEISNTIKLNPLNFWYFNNGITAITDSIDPFYPDSANVMLGGIQVINGAQTVFSVSEVYKYANENERKKIDENALISFRIVKSGGEDFDLKVTRYTNSQNPISERDFHSNDEVQKRLQSDFFDFTNIWYETRRGEFRKRIKGIIILKNETLGQTYLAYKINDPFNAKQNKKLIFSSEKNPTAGLYNIIYNSDTHYDDMLISYYLYLLVDKKRKELKKDIDQIDTTKTISLQEKRMLKFDFIQYANFDILALFNIFFNRVNEDNQKGINGKLISYFEKEDIEKVEKAYLYIIDYLFKYVQELKRNDPKIVNSVLFKSKDFYKRLSNKFDQELCEECMSDYKL